MSTDDAPQGGGDRHALPAAVLRAAASASASRRRGLTTPATAPAPSRARLANATSDRQRTLLPMQQQDIATPTPSRPPEVPGVQDRIDQIFDVVHRIAQNLQRLEQRVESIELRLEARVEVSERVPHHEPGTPLDDCGDANVPETSEFDVSRELAADGDIHPRRTATVGTEPAANDGVQDGSNSSYSGGGAAGEATPAAARRTSLVAGPDLAALVESIPLYCTRTDGQPSAVRLRPEERITDAPGPIVQLLRAVAAAPSQLCPPYHLSQGSATKSAETANKALAAVELKLQAAIADEVARTTSLSTAYELDRAVVVKVVTIALAQEVNNPLLIGKLLAQSVCAKYPDSPMARTFRKDKRMAPNVLDLFGLARVGTITATQADDRAVSRVTRCTQHAASSPVVFVSVFFEAVREMLETVNDATARDNCVAMLPDTLRRNSQEYFYTELLQAQASLPAHYTSRDDPTEYVNALRTWAAAVADAARERVAQHQRLDVAGQRTNPAASNAGGKAGPQQQQQQQQRRRDKPTGFGAGSGGGGGKAPSTDRPSAPTKQPDDYTSLTKPCPRATCRAPKGHLNGADASCRYWCHDPACVKAGQGKHMRVHPNYATGGLTSCSSGAGRTSNNKGNSGGSKQTQSKH